MGGEHDFIKVVLIVAVGPSGTEGGFGGNLFTEGGTPFVYPHIADRGAGDEVAKPCMTQFVAHGHLARGVK